MNLELPIRVAGQVAGSLASNWPFLVASIVLATLMTRSLDRERVGAFLRRHRRGGVVVATAAAVTTPLCSCGTTAVVLGMMAGSLPWAPIIAFLVASPLTSPGELVYAAGLFGWRFAGAFFVASIVLGLLGGLLGHLIESRGWLEGQARLRTSAHPDLALRPRAAAPRPPRFGATALARDFWSTGTRLLGLFVAFSAVGYLLNDLIPAQWMGLLFGRGHAYGVPLAATLGLPLYVNTEASLPLVRGMIGNGMSAGASLAFLVTGAGTSVGAIAGTLVIARWRVVGLVVATLWIGAVSCGMAYDAALAAGWM